MSSDYTIIFVGSTAMFLMVAFVFAFAFLYQRKVNQKKAAVKEIEDLLRKQELTSAYEILEAQDAERDRIANDLHDRMGGQLSTLKIYVDLLDKEEDEKKRCELLEKMNEGLKHSIQDVRSIAHDLSSATLKHYGLQKAIEHLVEAINESGKVSVKYHLSIHFDIPTGLVRDVYLIVQELVNNTLKHAKAKNIRLELTAINGELNIIFEDDGIGIPQGVKLGLGLESIDLRVKRYDGKLTRESSNGTTFVIEIPLKND